MSLLPLRAAQRRDVATDDRRVELTLLDSGERDGFDLDAIPPRSGGWIDYVAATAWSLADDGIAKILLPAARGFFLFASPNSFRPRSKSRPVSRMVVRM